MLPAHKSLTQQQRYLALIRYAMASSPATVSFKPPKGVKEVTAIARCRDAISALATYDEADALIPTEERLHLNELRSAGMLQVFSRNGRCYIGQPEKIPRVTNTLIPAVLDRPSEKAVAAIAILVAEGFIESYELKGYDLTDAEKIINGECSIHQLSDNLYLTL